MKNAQKVLDFLLSFLYHVPNRERKDMKAIYFDMDGTIYDLYGVRDWLPRLQSEDVTAYTEGEPLYDMFNLNSLLEDFNALGVVIGVITWTAKDGSREYNKKVRRAKLNWVRQNLPCVTEFHCVKYGTPKHQVCTYKDSILVDDNAKVRAAWKYGETVDATQNIEIVLKKLLTALIKDDTMCA